MSVRWTRTAKISNGKFMEAIAWAKETSGFVEKKFNLPKVGVWVDSFGEMGLIRWSIDFPDLGAVDKVLSAAMMDPEYWKMIERATKAGLFIEGSTIDTVARQV